VFCAVPELCQPAEKSKAGNWANTSASLSSLMFQDVFFPKSFIFTRVGPSAYGLNKIADYTMAAQVYFCKLEADPNP
jgi:hypothetical protein